jgi:hypothetical protein
VRKTGKTTTKPLQNQSKTTTKPLQNQKFRGYPKRGTPKEVPQKRYLKDALKSVKDQAKPEQNQKLVFGSVDHFITIFHIIVER